MFTLVLLEIASQELEEAAIWYETKSEGLGNRFLDTIQRKLQLIQQFPERYPKHKKSFREAIVKTFPYIIVYTFYKPENTIVVNTIFHAKQSPKKKYRSL